MSLHGCLTSNQEPSSRPMPRLVYFCTSCFLSLSSHFFHAPILHWLKMDRLVIFLQPHKLMHRSLSSLWQLRCLASCLARDAWYGQMMGHLLLQVTDHETEQLMHYVALLWMCLLCRETTRSDLDLCCSFWGQTWHLLHYYNHIHLEKKYSGDSLLIFLKNI